MSGPAGAAEPIRVLVVDDDVDTCELYAMSLTPLGCVVTCEYDGEAAVERLLSETFDIAMVDLTLHQVDGFEVARRTRAALGERAPSLVAVSGYGGANHREASREAGFVEHHVKPFSLQDIAACIARLGRARGA